MIPRQEYEILAFMHEFYRWPEILQMTTDEVGAQAIIDIGAKRRREVGTKVNCVHDGVSERSVSAWAAAACSRWKRSSPKTSCGEQHNPQIHAADPVGQAAGRLDITLQNRYRCQIHEKDTIDKLKSEIEYFEHESETFDSFVRFNASAELLSFLDHYDCRLGLGDRDRTTSAAAAS